MDEAVNAMGAHQPAASSSLSRLSLAFKLTCERTEIGETPSPKLGACGSVCSSEAIGEATTFRLTPPPPPRLEGLARALAALDPIVGSRRGGATTGGAAFGAPTRPHPTRRSAECEGERRRAQEGGYEDGRWQGAKQPQQPQQPAESPVVESPPEVSVEVLRGLASPALSPVVLRGGGGLVPKGALSAWHPDVLRQRRGAMRTECACSSCVASETLSITAASATGRPRRSMRRRFKRFTMRWMRCSRMGRRTAVT